MFGIAALRSATLNVESLSELVPRQMIYAAVGLVVVFVAAAIDYRFWASLSGYLYALMMLGLAITFVTGITQHGAQRWLDFGIIQIQPSELAKVLLSLTLSAFVARHQEDIRTLRGVARSLVHLAPPIVMVFLQPDLSTALLLGVIWLAIVIAAGMRFRHLGLLAAIGLLAVPIAWQFLQPYQQARVITFLLPDANPAAKYNVEQALIAIGSGGWLGQGYGHGTQVQLHFLRVRHTDFIFSAIAQEFGLIGALLLIVALAFVVIRCLRAGRLARDPFGAYVCYAVATLIFYQVSFNVGMNLNLLPVAGLPLPFISYGGSTLLTLLLGIGLVQSVVLRHRQIEF